MSNKKTKKGIDFSSAFRQGKHLADAGPKSEVRDELNGTTKGTDVYFDDLGFVPKLTSYGT
jgi:hypothetical protein